MILFQTTDTHYGVDKKSHNHHYKILRRLRKAMDAVSCKVLLHNGDWSCYMQQRQLRRTWQMFREVLGDITILTVLGNHEYWFNKWCREDMMLTFPDMVEQQDRWAEEFGIHILSRKGPVRLDDVQFVGFDGWYREFKGPMLDRDYMHSSPADGMDIFPFMQKRAQDQFYAMLDTTRDGARKVVCMTHFPLNDEEMSGNGRWLPFIKEKCDVLCYGHDHRAKNQFDENLLLINAGSGYGNIKFVSFEV